ncbi:MAG TPA: hypothetical protein VJR46_08170 [Candidatus Dormibacteraeota bacterium]|nr:hypothetical protein [Candidatus Dormibacteraeota bacterium]
MSTEPPTAPLEAPVDPLFTHPASPFEHTNPPTPLAFAAPQEAGVWTGTVTPMTAWVTYRTQIQFGFAILAFLMILVGAVTVVAANSSAEWRYWVALLPGVPAGVVVWLVVRELGRLDEVQKRMQMQAIGFALATTGLVTFAYGFFEGAGLPQMSAVLVLPLMAAFWGLGLFGLALRQRLRR